MTPVHLPCGYRCRKLLCRELYLRMSSDYLRLSTVLPDKPWELVQFMFKVKNKSAFACLHYSIKDYLL